MWQLGNRILTKNGEWLRTKNSKHRSRRLLWTDSVADRSSDADDVVRREVVAIIHDMKDANFGSKEHVSPDVVSDAAAYIDEEVIGTGVACAKVDAAAGGLVAIETGALPPDSAEQIDAGLLAEFRLKNAIEGEKQGPVRLTARTTKFPLASFPVHVESRAETILKNDVSAEVQVSATLFRAYAVATGIYAAVRPCN